MQQKECEDTWGDFEVLRNSHYPTHQIPVESERGKRSPTFSQGPRRGDWTDTRNNFTRLTAAVPLAAAFTTAKSTGSARLGCVVLLGTNLLVGTR
jgi:hypothetical protein